MEKRGDVFLFLPIIAPIGVWAGFCDVLCAAAWSKEDLEITFLVLFYRSFGEGAINP
jgi:hypothetical protein